VVADYLRNTEDRAKEKPAEADWSISQALHQADSGFGTAPTIMQTLSEKFLY
jgi:hypothetical protein